MDSRNVGSDAANPPRPEPPKLSKFQEKLVLDHLYLANNVATSEWNKARHALELEELRALTYKGLVEAADRWPEYCREKEYDVNATQFFPKVATLRMRGSVIDALRAEDWATRAQRQKSRRLRAAGQDRGASVSEMAEQSGLTEKEVHDNIRDMTKRPVSLEAEEIDTPMVTSLESTVLVNFLLQTLVETITSMDAVTQTVLALHYFEERELQDIAKILGITEHRSSELHTDSVIRIRAALTEATMAHAKEKL